MEANANTFYVASKSTFITIVAAAAVTAAVISFTSGTVAGWMARKEVEKMQKKSTDTK